MAADAATNENDVNTRKKRRYWQAETLCYRNSQATGMECNRQDRLEENAPVRGHPGGAPRLERIRSVFLKGRNTPFLGVDYPVNRRLGPARTAEHCRGVAPPTHSIAHSRSASNPSVATRSWTCCSASRNAPVRASERFAIERSATMKLCCWVPRPRLCVGMGRAMPLPWHSTRKESGDRALIGVVRCVTVPSSA
jgi:hypothetical protein